MTITDFILHPKQQLRDTTRIAHIQQGYLSYSFKDTQPIKTNYHTRYSTIKENNGTHAIGFVRAAWDQNFVADPRCLRSAQNILQHIFQNHPKIMKALEKGLPGNLISVTWAENGFDCGGPDDPRFNLVSGNEQDSLITYKKLSPNVQIGQYHNPSNVTFLAGVTYYMEPAGEARYFESDSALIRLARCGAEQWPLMDRPTRNPLTYGRYCEKAGNQVVVDCSGENGGPIRHVEYDHAANKWMYKECEECLVESFNYKFEGFERDHSPASSPEKKRSERRATSAIFSSNSNLRRLLRSPIQTTKELKAFKQVSRGFPTTPDPFVPKIMSQLNTFERITSPDGVATIGIARAPEGPQIVNLKSLEMIKDFILTVYPEFKDFDVKKSRNTIAISFALRNFQVGHHFHEFNLIPEFKPAEEGYFTYQKLSPNVQVTYYNEGGHQFLAGICYFPVLNGKALLLGSDKALMTTMEYVGILYPFKAEEAFRNGKECYGRKCKRTGRRVVVGKTEDGRIRHLRYNHWSRQWEQKYCEECIVDWFSGGVKKEDVRKVEEETPNTMPLRPLLSQIHTESPEPPGHRQFRMITRARPHNYFELLEPEALPVEMPVRPPPENLEEADEEEEEAPKSSEVLNLDLNKWEESEFIPFSKRVTKPLSVAIDIPEEVCGYAYKPPGSTVTFDVRNGEIIDKEGTGTTDVVKKDKKKSVSQRSDSKSSVSEISTTCVMENPVVSSEATALQSETMTLRISSPVIIEAGAPKAIEISEAPEISTTLDLANPVPSSAESAECTIWGCNSAQTEATVTQTTSTCHQILPHDFPDTLSTNDPATELLAVINRIKNAPITDGDAKELLTIVVQTLDAVNMAQKQGSGGFKPQGSAPKAPTQCSGGSDQFIPLEIAPDVPAPATEPAKDGTVTPRTPVVPDQTQSPNILSIDIVLKIKGTAPVQEAPIVPTVSSIVTKAVLAENPAFTAAQAILQDMTFEENFDGLATIPDFKSENCTDDDRETQDLSCSVILPLPASSASKASSASSSRASSPISYNSCEGFENKGNKAVRLSVKSVTVDTSEDENDFEEIPKIQDPQAEAPEAKALESDEEYDII